MKAIEPNPRLAIMRRLGEMARLKGMPCTLSPSDEELIKRREKQKVAIERRLKARHGE